MRIKLSIVLLAISICLLQGQQVKSIGNTELEGLLNRTSDSVYVINFWATWCAPCVAEIGYFEELNTTFRNRKLKVVLVNLDFPNQVAKRLIPFITEKNLTAEVVNMTNLDYNSWIPLVDEDWSGALPATLIYRGKERSFISKELERKELFEQVKEYLDI